MDQSTDQKAQQWLLGIGRREEWGVTASAYPASLGGDENGLEFDTDDGSTTLSIILFKWMNFLLYELYLNKKKILILKLATSGTSLEVQWLRLDCYF